MDLFGKFRIVDDCYNQTYNTTFEDYGKSPFLPTPRELIFEVLQILLNQNYINQETVILDLGSGTGDVVAISSFVFGIPSKGIEYDPKLIKFAKERAEELKDIFGEVDLEYYCGDFTDPDLLDYNSIDIVYNFLSADLSSLLDQLPSHVQLLTYGFGKDGLGYNQSDESLKRNIHRNNNFQNLSRNIRSHVHHGYEQMFNSWQLADQIGDTNFFLFTQTS